MNRLNFVLFALSILVVSSLLSSAPISDSTLLHAPRIHIKDGTSTNWAGYAVQYPNLYPNDNSNVVTDVKGSWKVPSVKCGVTPSAYSSFWIGIDGYSDGTVEQTGTDSDCSSGSPVYYAWYEMYPKFPVNLRMTIKSGDLMSAEVKYVGSGNFQLTITDTTTGASFSTTQKLKSAQRSSAEWIAEAPSSSSGVLPLADFTNVNFASAQATINGHTGTISDAAWHNDAITMTTSSGTSKATPSSLSTDGSSFSVAWNSAGP